MPFKRIVVALILVAFGLAISACHPPIPKVVGHMTTSFIETFPLAAINWPAHVLQAEGLTRGPGPMESHG
jgi:hypothetical protein